MGSLAPVCEERREYALVCVRAQALETLDGHAGSVLPVTSDRRPVGVLAVMC